jgi:hypothetical protein
VLDIEDRTVAAIRVAAIDPDLLVSEAALLESGTGLSWNIKFVIDQASRMIPRARRVVKCRSSARCVD